MHLFTLIIEEYKEAGKYNNIKFTSTPRYAIIFRDCLNNNISWEKSTLEKEKKTEIIKTYQAREGDTGTTEVQVALITGRINELTGHMAANRHDHHSQRGLLQLVGQRRRLLAYLSREDVGRYNQLIKKLGLRK
jgi:small subunit ribosomal protein S15